MRGAHDAPEWIQTHRRLVKIDRDLVTLEEDAMSKEARAGASAEKSRELQRILDAIRVGAIEDPDELSEQNYELLLEFHPSREEMETLFDELRDSEPER